MQNVFEEAIEHSNVIRALLLQGDPESAELAYSWLQGLEIDPADRRALGLTSASPSPDKIVAGISWLMSLGGPTMIAIDQIDAIVTAGNIIADKTAELDDETEARARTIVHLLAGGLMDLYDQTKRSMTIITSLVETWEIIRAKALQSAKDRFSLSSIELESKRNDRLSLERLVASRLRTAFTRHGVIPPYPTWPFRPEAFAEIEGAWPRRVLMHCDAYRQICASSGVFAECVSFTGGVTPPTVPTADLARSFEEHRAAAVVNDLTNVLDDGGLLGQCLRETLDLYLRQLDVPESVDSIVAAPALDARPALHARLTFIFHDQAELEKHFCFRVAMHAAALSVQSRLRAAMTDSGVDRKLPFRHLAIIRNDPMPSGKVTKQLTDKLLADGGIIVPINEDDLRTFVALRDMDAAKVRDFDVWLRQAKPLCETAFFKAVGLCPSPVSSTAPPKPSKSDLDLRTPSDLASAPDLLAPAPPSSPKATQTLAEPKLAPAPSNLSAKSAAVPPTSIPLGPRLQGGSLGSVAELPIPLLTRHTGIFAGSGSGKTVLLRRIVEEAALAGIPAIVLDTNNDLARLGTPWPSPPDVFGEADRGKADRYARDVDVAVWTPGVAAGRPLTLAVLPDFSLPMDDEERNQAIDMAWATLMPLVGATGAAKTPKEGLLKEALAFFAKEGRTDIEPFIDFLADLPSEVSKQTKAQKYGVDMSDQLRGKIAVNPLLNAKGQPLDPEVLFTASRPGATRISVINFSGLEAEASRQDFVNQLQMALFTFIRRKPSKTPRLYVCDEAQNFAPSQASTASKASALALVRQGRKFGLGMIFATQAPKGIDTNIVSNCVTHFYGRMSSPALIDATEEMMAQRGKAAKDLGTLTAGTFYFSTEGTPQPVKIKTPLCLSYHPQNPATPDEVAVLAHG